MALEGTIELDTRSKQASLCGHQGVKVGPSTCKISCWFTGKDPTRHACSQELFQLFVVSDCP